MHVETFQTIGRSKALIEKLKGRREKKKDRIPRKNESVGNADSRTWRLWVGVSGVTPPEGGFTVGGRKGEGKVFGRNFAKREIMREGARDVD